MRQRTRLQPLSLLVDASAYYALLNRRDSNHTPSLAIRGRLDSERWQFFTTSFILAETHALLINRLGQRNRNTI